MNRSLPTKRTYFNPRSREGSDIPKYASGIGIPISIHAPVKGATSWLSSRLTAVRHFNPRSREGSDEF